MQKPHCVLIRIRIAFSASLQPCTLHVVGRMTCKKMVTKNLTLTIDLSDMISVGGVDEESTYLYLLPNCFTAHERYVSGVLFFMVVKPGP